MPENSPIMTAQRSWYYPWIYHAIWNSELKKKWVWTGTGLKLESTRISSYLRLDLKITKVTASPLLFDFKNLKTFKN